MLDTYPYSIIGNGVYEINEFDGASMFLIVGREKALLIDTGVGIGDLKGFIVGLTDLPVDVLLTHNHRDHVGNAPQFKKVYISRLDTRMGPMLRPLTTKESRLQFAYNARKIHPDRNYLWSEADFDTFTQEPEIDIIEDGFEFDLGMRKVKCIWTPGHTPGSFSAIDDATGILFCGDACNRILGLGIRPIEGMKHATVEEALIGLYRLNRMDFDHKQIFNGHSDSREQGKPLDEDVLAAVIEGMEMIVNSNYISHPKHIASINADVEIVTYKGVELQFHSELIHGILYKSERRKQ